MRIWPASDGHGEFTLNRFQATRPSGDADVCLLVGDFGSPLSASLEYVQQAYARAVDGRPILYVPGNHDFYNAGKSNTPSRTWDQIFFDGLETAERLGIQVMADVAEVPDKEGRSHLVQTGRTLQIGDTRFICGTLWTDFSQSRENFIDFATAKRSVTKQGESNDYRRIKYRPPVGSGSLESVTPDMTIEWHERTRAFIEQELVTPFIGNSVVATHFPATPRMLKPGGRNLDLVYASNLEHLMHGENAPLLWLSGHVHRSFDEVIGNTLVASNPRGHQRGVLKMYKQAENPAFNEHLVYDLDEVRYRLGRQIEVEETDAYSIHP